MQVGVNYPWLNYGWDFGLGPPSWRGSQTDPQWFRVIDAHLQYFQSLGITVVRWFILADGLTYGTDSSAPYPDGAAPGEWRFDPPALAPEITQNFEELLQRFENINRIAPQSIQLLPVFIDFHFCFPGITPVEKADPDNPQAIVPDLSWVKKGRADAITDPYKRQRFLEQALDPLLRVAQRHLDVIYAWELINEPDWITNGWNPDGQQNHPVDETAMQAFIADGQSRVRAAGMKSTIGFASINTLLKSKITAEINQFHHYPGGSSILGRNDFDPLYPGIVGEFASASGDIWPELPQSGQTVLNRLRQIEAQGYPLAIPWSFGTKDQHTSWTPEVERDIECYTQGRNCP